MKKICHLTSVHSRYDVRIFIKECRSLAKVKNFKVNLIVADDLGSEVVDDVSIHDVGKLNGRINRIFRTTRKVLEKAIELDCDIYHFHDPELIPVGINLKKRGKKVIYDIHENLVEQIKIKIWIPKIFRNIGALMFQVVENFASKKFDVLIVPQPSMLNNYAKINDKTVLVENFVIVNIDSFKSKKDFNNKNAFHAGVLSKDRGLLNMVNAYELLDDSNHLHLAGNIRFDKLDEFNKIMEFSNISYLGVLPYKDSMDYYNNTSIGLILYNNVGQYYLSYAIKLFEYMMNSIPVIMPNFGEWVAFNNENNCGINVDPLNPIEVAEAINFLNNNIKIKEQLGINGRKAVLEKYNWDISKTKLLELYESLSHPFQA